MHVTGFPLVKDVNSDQGLTEWHEPLRAYEFFGNLDLIEHWMSSPNYHSRTELRLCSLVAWSIPVAQTELRLLPTSLMHQQLPNECVFASIACVPGRCLSDVAPTPLPMCSSLTVERKRLPHRHTSGMYGPKGQRRCYVPHASGLPL